VTENTIPQIKGNLTDNAISRAQTISPYGVGNFAFVSGLGSGAPVLFLCNEMRRTKFDAIVSVSGG